MLCRDNAKVVELFWSLQSSSKRKAGSVVRLATKESVKSLASFSMIRVFASWGNISCTNRKQSRKNYVTGYGFPATFSALMDQVPPFVVERLSHVDQRIEVWNCGWGMSIVDQKYTAYDHFQGIGSYGEKKKNKRTKYEQIRTFRLVLGLPCHNK